MRKKCGNVIGHLTEANPDYRHPFLVEREAKAVGIIVISTDRGLAGGLNANIFKQTLLLMREWQAKGRDGKPVHHRLEGARLLPPPRRADSLANVSGLGDRPHVKDLIGTVKVMLDAYSGGELDRLFLVNAQFVNTMTQKPTAEQLLPIQTLDTEGLAQHWTTSTSRKRS